MNQIKHTDLSVKVYEILKRMIFKRQFKGGQKLDLNSLSEKMNISRTPLKEAINQLRNDGLVEVYPRRGTYVKKVTIKDIVNMMEMRLMMEKWAINHYNDIKIKEVIIDLEQVFGMAENIIQSKPFDYDEFLKFDSKFHKIFVTHHGNEKMTETYELMNIPFQIARVFYFKNYQRSIETQMEHSQIIQAFKRNDLQKAIKLLTNHLNTSKERMITILNENSDEI